MEWLLKEVETFISSRGPNLTFWVAFSGGMDSHVLLHLCAELLKRRPFSLHAIYVNHGLSPHAEAWGLHCADICKQLHVPFFQEKIIVSAEGLKLSPEEMARVYRYEILASKLSHSDCLLTAHHQEDQAETVLLQLLRGGGPKGLSAMPRIKTLKNTLHGRPLLQVARHELKKYAEIHQLQWIEDESNSNAHFTRNFLRHAIFPLLKKRWPSVHETIARAADHCAETQLLLEEILEEDWQKIKISDFVLSLKKLMLLSAPRQRQLLRYWFQRQGFLVPSAIKLRQLQHDFTNAALDKSPHLVWQNVELRRYQDHLYLMPILVPHDRLFSAEWDLRGPLFLPAIGHLRATLHQGRGLNRDFSEVTVRFRQGGERCRLPGRPFHHDLKKLFQTWGVPPWQRDRVPCIFINNDLVAVGHYFIDEQFQAKPEGFGYCFSITP